MPEIPRTSPRAAIGARGDQETEARFQSIGSRRTFLKRSCQYAAATAVAAGSVPHVHGAEDNTIRLALIGCGGRGAGAAAQALQTKGPIRLWAMADLLSSRLEASLQALSSKMNDLIEAIRQDKPYNEAENGTTASLVAAMRRMAAHTGQVVTYDEMLNHKHEFAPDIDKLTLDSPSPLPAGLDGGYPWPQPGILTDREY